MDDDDLLRRAFAAWRGYQTKINATPTQPSNASYVRELDGKTYAVLVNVGGVLAVFLLLANGNLRWCRTGPPI